MVLWGTSAQSTCSLWRCLTCLWVTVINHAHSCPCIYSIISIKLFIASMLINALHSSSAWSERHLRHLCQKTSYASTFVLLLCHSFSLANRTWGSVFSPRHAALIRTSFLWVKHFSWWLPQHRPPSVTLFLLLFSTVVFLWDFQEEYYARSNLKVDLMVVFSYICVF